MRKLPVWIGMTLLLAGCTTPPPPSPLQPPRPHPHPSASPAPHPSPTPQTWTLPNGNRVEIERDVADTELSNLNYPGATLVSAVRTRMAKPDYEQTEFILSSTDSTDTVRAWYQKHAQQNVRVTVHRVPTGSRIVVLRYR
ncbi:MAG: hypothetical protein ACYCW6_29900 [Candidatus Xenobia bacterium]